MKGNDHFIAAILYGVSFLVGCKLAELAFILLN